MSSLRASSWIGGQWGAREGSGWLLMADGRGWTREVMCLESCLWKGKGTGLRPRLISEWGECFCFPTWGFGPYWNMRPTWVPSAVSPVPGPQDWPLILLSRQVGLSPWVTWRRNMSQEFPVGHGKWEKEREQHVGKSGGILEVMQACVPRAADPWPLLPQIQEWGAPYLPCCLSISDWFSQWEGSQAGMESRVWRALTFILSRASCPLDRRDLEAQKGDDLPSRSHKEWSSSCQSRP